MKARRYTARCIFCRRRFRSDASAILFLGLYGACLCLACAEGVARWYRDSTRAVSPP